MLLYTFPLVAKDYKASLFGIVPDGITTNTGSIQYAIDYINKNGGGRLIFPVGRYLTGSFELKSNVILELNEGAVLVGVSSIYDYCGLKGTKALITANGQQNIGITGKGMIDGQGEALLNSIKKQVQKGYVKEDIVKEGPLLIYFNSCSNVSIEGIYLKESCGNIQSYTDCNNMLIKGITVLNNSAIESIGIGLDSCIEVQLSDSYFNTSGIELSKKGILKNIVVKNCINAKGKKIK